MTLSLSACGAGTSQDEQAGDIPAPISFDTFEEGQVIAEALRAENDALGLMNPADLLRVGTANYEGIAQISGTAGLNAIGHAILQVDFLTSAVFGTATDFLSETGQVDGTLEITSGTYDRNGGAGGALNVTVLGAFDAGQFEIVPSSIEGDFHGDADGITIDGLVDGLVNDAPTSFGVSIVTRQVD